MEFKELCKMVSVGYVGLTTQYFSNKGEGIRLIRSQNVRPGKLILENTVEVTLDFHKRIRKSQLIFPIWPSDISSSFPY